MKAILAKIHAVMQDVNFIAKDKRNPHHGYDYASEYAIKDALGTAFRKHGIVFQLQTSHATISSDAKSTMIDCHYAFHDVESGECLEGDFVASGPARDDKGLWAATTNAIKYILTSTFLIPTGDDAENERNHPQNGETTKTAPKTDQPPKAPPAKREAAKTGKGKDTLRHQWAMELKKHGHRWNDIEPYNAVAATLIHHPRAVQMLGGEEPDLSTNNSPCWDVLTALVREISGQELDENIKMALVATKPKGAA